MACEKDTEDNGFELDVAPSSQVQSENKSEHIEAFKIVASHNIANARLPNIFKDDQGKHWMSYVTEAGTSTSLWISEWSSDQWSEPELVAQGENWFVNWADFPSVVNSKNKLMAHWLQKNGSGTYAYGVQYATKNESGAWQQHGLLHADDSPTEHGFVSLLPASEGIHAVWLDGRNMQADAGHDSHSHNPDSDKFDINAIQGMTLRYAQVTEDGLVSNRQELDELTCDCCQTTSAMSQNGLVVAYRDREVRNASSEIRDMKILRQTPTGWINAKNTPVDGWDIQACPVNGPVLAANKNHVAMAWFTAAEQQPKVKVVFSNDNAESFNSVIEVDTDNNLGRVGADWLDDDRLLVTWLGLHEGQAQFLYRIVNISGEMSTIQSVADINMSRASGVPQVATINATEALFVWTKVDSDSSDKVSLQTSRLNLQ